METEKKTFFFISACKLLLIIFVLIKCHFIGKRIKDREIIIIIFNGRKFILLCTGHFYFNSEHTQCKLLYVQ